ncbi:unnamed protein product [Parajaminaea phylloscopi]
MDHNVIPEMEAQAGFRPSNSRPLGGPGPKTEDHLAWLAGRQTSISLVEVRKAVLHRASEKRAETPGATHPSLRASRFGLHCIKSHASPSDRRWIEKRLEKARHHPKELRHGRVGFDDVEMGSGRSIAFWPDAATTSLTAKILAEGDWPHPRGVILRPLPIRDEKVVAAFVRDVASLSAIEGARPHPWQIATYEQWTELVVANLLVAQVGHDGAVSPAVSRAWDLLAAARASLPSVDKTFRVTIEARTLVQHAATNIQLLDRMSNKAKHTFTPAAAELQFIALLAWNLGQAVIGTERAQRIIAALSRALVSIDAPHRELDKLTRLGQTSLMQAVADVGTETLRELNQLVRLFEGLRSKCIADLQFLAILVWNLAQPIIGASRVAAIIAAIDVALSGLDATHHELDSLTRLGQASPASKVEEMGVRKLQQLNALARPMVGLTSTSKLPLQQSQTQAREAGIQTSRSKTPVEDEDRDSDDEDQDGGGGKPVDKFEDEDEQWTSPP